MIIIKGGLNKYIDKFVEQLINVNMSFLYLINILNLFILMINILTH